MIKTQLLKHGIFLAAGHQVVRVFFDAEENPRVRVKRDCHRLSVRFSGFRAQFPDECLMAKMQTIKVANGQPNRRPFRIWKTASELSHFVVHIKRVLLIRINFNFTSYWKKTFLGCHSCVSGMYSNKAINSLSPSMPLAHFPATITSFAVIR